MINNDVIDDETIIDLIKIDEGSEFNADLLNNVLKTLYETGFFKDVNIQKIVYEK